MDITFPLLQFINIKDVHKWRHAIFKHFEYPLHPVVTLFINMNLALSSQNLWPPPFPCNVTSFLDDPIGREKVWTEHKGVTKVTVIINVLKRLIHNLKCNFLICYYWEFAFHFLQMRAGFVICGRYVPQKQ